MHELTALQSVLENALHHAAEAGAGRVTDLYLVNGAISSYDDDSVRLYWPMVSEGTIAAAAELHFRHVPVELACQACGRRFPPAEPPNCPDCGSERVLIAAGREFYLEAIDVAAAEGAAAG
jgi:hydrogenase nickel incorporation protein HypA/HybF